ncbi:hypothetical protein QBC38DRAFT_454004 [Podospora fimiseda]|uniref:Carrier domain-containing protein n=1 Tax=Podospora fimiseda TaxID=252190 RepID=A0AAN7H1G4_9PEZI|nr:hypothetical protein QBC38DRAFT_454004 [Podospora fimiseda]
MRPLSSVVDRLAQEAPNGVWVKITRSSESSSIDQIAWEDFTWQQLQKAIDWMAHWFDQTLGYPAPDCNQITYTGINDIRYPIITLAAEKAGYKILVSSPRNSLEGHLSLLNKTNCKILLHSTELTTQITPLNQHSITTIEIPSLNHLLNRPTPTPYKSKCPSNPPSNFTILTLHSSGTTSLPKPIPIKAGVFAITDTLHPNLPTPPNRLNTHDPLYTTPLLVSMPPFFHAFGWNLLVRSIYHQKPLVLLPSTIPPTAELMIHAIAQTRPTGIVATPSILQDISSLETGLQAISKLDYVYFGGAPLSKKCGDLLCQKTTLVNGMGTTEVWNVKSLVPVEKEDWEYFEWNDMAGVVMEPVEGSPPDIAELVIKKKEEGLDKFQFIFKNFEHLKEWRTRDLYQRHSATQKQNLWKHIGRLDDVIVLSNGEKVNPVLFEREVEGCERIKGVLMVGERMYQTGLIVEPRVDVEDRERFIEEVWPWVEKANERFAAHGRVWKEMILVAVDGKPFERTAKGGVMRKKTVEMYREEIECMFSQQNDSVGLDGAVDAEMLRNIIRQAVGSVSGGNVDLNDETNLFKAGFDSLKTLQLIQLLRRGLPSRLTSTLSTRLIYENPTINNLVSALTLGLPVNLSLEEEISSIISKHATTPNAFPPLETPLPTQGNPFNVLLIGSTGSLGTHLLHTLLISPSPRINHIYCLNRSSNAPTRQTHSFSSYNLPQFDIIRITFIHHPQTLSQLPPQLINIPISLIIYNAWPVNFNLPLSSFDSSLSQTTNLLHLTESYFPTAKFVFISSVSSVFNSAAANISEEFVFDHTLPLKQGYAQSKHVASCLISRAIEEGRLKNGVILRVGQLTGPVKTKGKSKWNEKEWVPLLINTSLSMGKIPDRLGGLQGRIDWVGVDLAAKVITEIALGKNKARGLECWNVVNPQVGNWEEFIKSIQAYSKVKKGKEVEVIGVKQWVEELKKENDGEKYPALKLEFFEGWVTDEDDGRKIVFETERGMEKSQTLRGMKSVDGEMMRGWLDGWGF